MNRKLPGQGEFIVNVLWGPPDDDEQYTCASHDKFIGIWLLSNRKEMTDSVGDCRLSPNLGFEVPSVTIQI